MITGRPTKAQAQQAFDEGLAAVKDGTTLCPESGALSWYVMDALNVIALQGYTAERELAARTVFASQQKGTLPTSIPTEMFGLPWVANQTGPQGDPAERNA